MEKVKNYFNDWTSFEKAWLLISTLLILSLSLYWGDGIVGIVASLTGIWCVVLVAKGKIANYYVGIINIIAYAWVAYSWRFYGEVMLNMIYFLPMQFVGIYLWKNKMDSSVKRVKVRVMSNIVRFRWLLAIMSTIGLYGVWLNSLGGNLPFIDSASTVLSVVAMILMALRYVEQWALWIVVNIASIGLWIFALMNGGNDIAILIMWIAYLANSIYGLKNWIKLYTKGD